MNSLAFYIKGFFKRGGEEGHTVSSFNFKNHFSHE